MVKLNGKTNEPTPVPERPVKRSPDIPLIKGMKLSFGNYLYKVTASRPNGKITMKYIRRVEGQ